jgi:hypothetical protein
MQNIRRQLISTRGEFIAFLLGTIAAFAVDSFHYEIVLIVLLLVAPYETLEEPAKSLGRGMKAMWEEWGTKNDSGQS